MRLIVEMRKRKGELVEWIGKIDRALVKCIYTLTNYKIYTIMVYKTNRPLYNFFLIKVCFKKSYFSIVLPFTHHTDYTTAIVPHNRRESYSTDIYGMSYWFLVNFLKTNSNSICKPWSWIPAFLLYMKELYWMIRPIALNLLCKSMCLQRLMLCSPYLENLSELWSE